MRGCRPTTAEENRAIMDSFQGDYALRDRALVVLALTSGFRISECLSLRVHDLFQNGSWVKHFTVKASNTKQGTYSQTVALHPRAEKALTQWLLSGSGFWDAMMLFKSRQGANKAIDRRQATRILAAAKKAAGLTGKVSWHSFRKWFANECHEAFDGDIFKTAKALRHKSINSTASYLSFRQEEIDETVLHLRL